MTKERFSQVLKSGCDKPNLQCGLTCYLDAVCHDREGGHLDWMSVCWFTLQITFLLFTHLINIYLCLVNAVLGSWTLYSEWHSLSGPRMWINSTIVGRFLRFSESRFPPVLSPGAGLDQNLKTSASGIKFMDTPPCALCWTMVKEPREGDHHSSLTLKIYFPFERVQLIWFASVCIWSQFIAVLKLTYFKVWTRLISDGFTC